MIATAPIRQGEQVRAAAHIMQRRTLCISQGSLEPMILQGELPVRQMRTSLVASHVQEGVASGVRCHI